MMHDSNSCYSLKRIFLDICVFRFVYCCNVYLTAGSARSRQSYAARPPATQQNGQAEASEVKKPGIPVAGSLNLYKVLNVKSKFLKNIL